MPSSVRLNAASGCITFGRYTIPLGSKLDELAPTFERTEVQARVTEKIVPCIFATALIQEAQIKFELSLGYEKNRLVSASLSIWPKEFQELQDDAFYESVDARYSYHTRWLKSTGMPSGSYTEMPWGKVGVARDKSENVFIYLHANAQR